MHDPRLAKPISRTFVVIALASLWTGSLFGPWDSFRLTLVLGLGISLVASSRLRSISGPVGRGLLALGFLWVCWAVASILWTPDPLMGARDVVLIAGGLVAAITLVGIADLDHLEDARLGWLLAFLASVPIAAWELLTGHHLKVTLPQKGAETVRSLGVVQFPTTTFGQRNLFAMLLVFVVPFLLWLAEETRGTRRIVSLVFLVGAIGLVLATVSRLGIAAVLFQLFLWIFLPRRSIVPRLAGLAVAGIVILLLLTFADSSHLVLLQIRAAQAISGEDASGQARQAMIEDGAHMLADTYGMGVGAAGFESESVHLHPHYPTFGVINPHNLWIEIAAQYGLLVLAAFVAWLMFCWFQLWRGYKCAMKRGARLRHAFRAGLVLIATILPTSAMNSSMVRIAMFWAMIASVALLAHAAWHYRRTISSHGVDFQAAIHG